MRDQGQLRHGAVFLQTICNCIQIRGDEFNVNLDAIASICHTVAMPKDPMMPSEKAVHAWALLMRVSQSTLRRVEDDLKDQGFPPLAWYDALLELRRAKREGLRPFELRQEMLLAQYNLSRLVERLVRSGYVERFPAPDDGRGHVLCITAEGRALLKRMWPAYRSAIARHFAGRLSTRSIDFLTDALTRLRDP